MFGLMKHAPRMPYCGTCKTMGAIYGHRSRVFLNHDVVFLAELLMHHSAEPDWSDAYRSFNCLTLPGSEAQIPAVLQYAAAVNVALAHLHIADHRADAGGAKWRAAARWIAPAYRRASARLRQSDFPLDEMEAILLTQTHREAAPESLEHVAEPTAIATALVFEHGARVIGKSGLAHSLRSLGARFGHLIYVLDAYDDWARDARAGAFNPLQRFPEISARQEMLAALAEIETQLPPALAERLRVNVEERLGLRPRVLAQCCRRSAENGWNSAMEFARSLRSRERSGLVKGAAILATAAAIAYVFPHHARRAASWKECLSVPMNLMALGSVFAASPPPPPFPPPGPPPPPPGAGHRPFHPRPATPSRQSGVPGVGNVKSMCGDCCCESCGEGCGECCCSAVCESCSGCA
jgi:hypothetical protein